MGRGSSKIGGGSGGGGSAVQQPTNSGDGNFAEELKGLHSGNNGDVPNVINRLDSILDRMSTGQVYHAETTAEAQVDGEWTDWRFEKRSDGNFDARRDERVYTGLTRTGFEGRRYDEGIFTPTQVIAQTKAISPWDISFFKQGESSSQYYYRTRNSR